jgi:hypothetical protein
VEEEAAFLLTVRCIHAAAVGVVQLQQAAMEIIRELLSLMVAVVAAVLPFQPLVSHL